MKITAALALAVAAGAASAAIQSATVPGFATHAFGTAPHTSNPNVGSVLTGDTVDAAVTAFSSATGAFLSGPASHTVGGVDTLPSGAPGLIPDHFIETSVTTVGTTRTLDIAIYATADFTTALAPAGLALDDGDPGTTDSLESLFFEIPDLNGGPDLFDDPEKSGPATGTFDLIGTDVADPATPIILFGTAAGITDGGTSFSVGNGVSTGAGTDIFDGVAFFVTGGVWTITYEIPAPATAGLLGLGGLVAVRRRR